MSLETWALFCVTEAVLCFIPGPAVLLVVSTALSRGARQGIAASFGILAANTMYFALSATSLGAVLLASWELFSLIRWAGAAYLIWLGARMALAAWRGRVPVGDAMGEPARGGSRLGSFASGFMTQGANPKALLFFSAILPQFIDPAAGVVAQVMILGASSIVIELGVLGAYVAAVRRARAWAGRPRVASLLEGAGGILLVAAGARLAALSRS